MRQMAGEELGVGVDRIELVEGDTALTPDQGPTAGSSGVMRGGVQLRQAAATAREALIAMAAERLQRAGRRARRSSTAKCARRRRPRARRRPSWSATARFDVKINPKAPLKRPGAVHAGRQVAAAARRPGEGHRPPRLRARLTRAGHAARPRASGRRRSARSSIAVDESSVAALPGVRVVRIADFVGVVAPTNGPRCARRAS